jgi:hypothetical protein
MTHRFIAHPGSVGFSIFRGDKHLIRSGDEGDRSAAHFFTLIPAFFDRLEG